MRVRTPLIWSRCFVSLAAPLNKLHDAFHYHQMPGGISITTIQNWNTPLKWRSPSSREHHWSVLPSPGLASEPKSSTFQIVTTSSQQLRITDSPEVMITRTHSDNRAFGKQLLTMKRSAISDLTAVFCVGWKRVESKCRSTAASTDDTVLPPWAHSCPLQDKGLYHLIAAALIVHRRNPYSSPLNVAIAELPPKFSTLFTLSFPQPKAFLYGRLWAELIASTTCQRTWEARQSNLSQSCWQTMHIQPAWDHSRPQDVKPHPSPAVWCTLTATMFQNTHCKHTEKTRMPGGAQAIKSWPRVVHKLVQLSEKENKSQERRLLSQHLNLKPLNRTRAHLTGALTIPLGLEADTQQTANC